MSLKIAKLADCSFLRFVYPFTFRPETFDQREQAIDTNAGVWLPAAFPVGETLSHVADYLKPPEGQPRAARLWKLSAQNHNPLRLTPDIRGSIIAGKREIPFTFGGSQKNSSVIELALFRIGVGFLTVTVRPADPDVGEWLAFLHYFRVMGGGHNVSLRLLPPADVQRAFQFSTEDPKGSNFSHILDTLLSTAALPEETKEWWHDVFVPGRMIPFGALFVDGLESEAERARLLYRVKNFFREEQIVSATPEELQIKDNPAFMPYAEGQQFVFSLEGGSFVAFDAPKTEFFRVTLPSHLRDEYFLVFLLTLHQRFALMRLSQRVAERWGGEAERVANFERIREAFLDFSARGYFVQVMQREHHHRFYRRWHQVYQLDLLYQEVRDEVREMHEYLRMKQAERAREIQEEMQKFQVYAQKTQQAQTNLITYIVAALTLTCAVFGFMSINIQGMNVPSVSQRFAEALVGGVAVASALLILPALLHVCTVKREVEQDHKASRVGRSEPLSPPCANVIAPPER